MRLRGRCFLLLVLAAGCGLVCPPDAGAARLRDYLVARYGDDKATTLSDIEGVSGVQMSPDRVIRGLDGAAYLANVPYGDDPKQTMDVYISPRVKSGEVKAAPVLFVVHGGAWMIGDKALSAVVRNKALKWLPLGFVLVSINYPLVPSVNIMDQSDHVRAALAFAQKEAPKWGADPDRFVLMGYSAGAHLAAIVNAAPARAYQFGARPWLGAVLLDSAVLDVPSLMQQKHYGFFDPVFGRNPAVWTIMSPFHQVTAQAFPTLLVCSVLRSGSCPAAKAYAAKAKAVGARAEVLSENLTHAALDSELGRGGLYTEAVDDFLKSLLLSKERRSP